VIIHTDAVVAMARAVVAIHGAPDSYGWHRCGYAPDADRRTTVEPLAGALSTGWTENGQLASDAGAAKPSDTEAMLFGLAGESASASRVAHVFQH
jgi:hypothetical protein